MRLLKIQSRPGLGRWRSKITDPDTVAPRGLPDAGKAKIMEARSKAPFTTIQGRKPFPDNPVGPL